MLGWTIYPYIIPAACGLAYLSVSPLGRTGTVSNQWKPVEYIIVIFHNGERSWADARGSPCANCHYLVRAALRAVSEARRCTSTWLQLLVTYLTSMSWPSQNFLATLALTTDAWFRTGFISTNLRTCYVLNARVPGDTSWVWGTRAT